jgi:2-oxoglutarate/2-oxoacid ferredoxin oxidoreductase subunit alpha
VAKPRIEVDRVVVRFAGDSGDGMQLTGNRMTAQSAAVGNDIATWPDFPAEIRAPQGTLPGVSSFQLHFADHEVTTPGDVPHVLVAMNPAALKANVGAVPKGGTLIVDTAEFTQRNLAKVGYEGNPLTDGTLDSYALHAVDMTGMTLTALDGLGLSRKDASRAKNMFALGLVSWLYHRPVSGTEDFLTRRFASNPTIRDANLAAFRAGWNFGETTEEFASAFEVPPSSPAPGTYRAITGNQALSFGLVVAARRAGLPLFLGSYPITPASDILHELSKLKSLGVRTFQAEDEIAGAGSALGAAFGGALGVTTTSGPGVALKSETIGLAVSLELPMVVVDVQRGGPSTGLPTKTEQSDLLQVMFGRNGESPLPVIAASSPSDCYETAIEAVRIAVTYRTPVVLLSDGYLANGSEPWLVPDPASVAPIAPDFATDPKRFEPYSRDPATMARPWAIPGTAGLEHRLSGLEKQDGSGVVSYDPDNHDRMVRLRQAKVDKVADSYAPLVVDDPEGKADLLVLGWGSTYGIINSAVEQARRAGRHVAQLHLRHINPFPHELGETLRRYQCILVPEMNLGQLALLVRARYLVDARPVNQVRGMPFRSDELLSAIEEHCRG